MLIGRAVLALGRRVKPMVPASARKWMDDRLFSVIFQATRVTNDNYGYGVQGRADSSQSG
jgi:hypothetical protein